MTAGGTTASLGNGLTLVAAALSLVGIFVWPFLLEPIAAVLLLVSAKTTPDPRLTRPVAVLITLATIAGFSVAVGFSRALY